MLTLRPVASFETVSKHTARFVFVSSMTHYVTSNISMMYALSMMSFGPSYKKAMHALNRDSVMGIH